MSLANSWRAEWRERVLVISGTTDLFPNDFSTAALRREPGGRDSEIATYRLTFARDKEPFCGPDLVGPVSHYESSLEPRIRRLKIVAPNGHELAVITVPHRARSEH